MQIIPKMRFATKVKSSIQEDVMHCFHKSGEQSNLFTDRHNMALDGKYPQQLAVVSGPSQLSPNLATSSDDTAHDRCFPSVPTREA